MSMNGSKLKETSIGRFVVTTFSPLSIFCFARAQIFFFNLDGCLSSAAGKIKNPIQEN